LKSNGHAAPKAKRGILADASFAIFFALDYYGKLYVGDASVLVPASSAERSVEMVT
jgi:hypothetical protein